AGVLNPLGTAESLELAHRADLVLFAGTKVGQNTSHNWTLPLAEQATIHLDSDASELGRTFRPTVALNGDARATLEALTVRLRPHARRAWLAEAEKLRAQGRRDREALEE